MENLNSGSTTDLNLCSFSIQFDSKQHVGDRVEQIQREHKAKVPAQASLVSDEYGSRTQCGTSMHETQQKKRSVLSFSSVHIKTIRVNRKFKHHNKVEASRLATDSSSTFLLVEIVNGVVEGRWVLISVDSFDVLVDGQQWCKPSEDAG